jgi:biotin carboxyl carrier protein
MTYELMLGGEPVEFKVDVTPEKTVIQLNGTPHDISLQDLGSGRWLIANSAGQRIARVARDRDRIWVWIGGRIFDFVVPSEEREGGVHRGAPQHEVHAPMPGTLVKLLVAAGDSVEEGQVIAVVEAMKMEHPLRAPRGGVVEAVFGEAGKIVDADAVIVSLVREE